MDLGNAMNFLSGISVLEVRDGMGVPDVGQESRNLRELGGHGVGCSYGLRADVGVRVWYLV